MARRGLHVLWLGETLLLPHIWPIVDAFARAQPTTPITIWISTSAHEATLARLLEPEHAHIVVARAPLFKDIPNAVAGQNPHLPPKLPMLAALLPHLRRADVVLVAEQTSLWLPKLLGKAVAPFVFTVHGAGPISHGRWKRLRAADAVMVPSDLMRDEMVVAGVGADKVKLTGYAKSAFPASVTQDRLFPENRPTILYNPHWQAHRSSWPKWGVKVIAAIVESGAWNLIFAPHQRLIETAPEVADAIALYANHPHVHTDLDSFAMVDGSYPQIADLYLGDTSSLVLEFVARPRPVVLLRPDGLRWDEAHSGQYQTLGETVREVSDLLPALARAETSHGKYRPAQADYAAQTLGLTGADGIAPAVAILAAYCT